MTTEERLEWLEKQITRQDLKINYLEAKGEGQKYTNEDVRQKIRSLEIRIYLLVAAIGFAAGYFIPRMVAGLI